MNFHVKFVSRLLIVLAKEAPLEASFRIHYKIPTCIEHSIINEMHQVCFAQKNHSSRAITTLIFPILMNVTEINGTQWLLHVQLFVTI